MESIEKLRTAARNMAKGRNLENHEECNLLLIIADEIEREIAEKYMLLPVDANGVPIHVGDEVMYGVGNAAHYVFAVSENAAWLNNSFDPPLVFLQEFASEQCRHVKPRTVKDVLEDFIIAYDEWDDYSNGDDRMCERELLFSRFADELQMQGDE